MRSLHRLFSSSKRITHSFQHVILGAGDAGGSLAELLRKQTSGPNKTLLIAPETVYTFQPGYTKVGCGFFKEEDLKIPNKSRIPREATVLQGTVKLVHPSENLVELSDGSFVEYKELIIATGTQPKPSLTKGFEEALNDPHCPVATVYLGPFATKFARLRENFNGGTALFCQPKSPVKCLGANQKVMYFSASQWTGKKPAQIEFHTGGERMLGPEYYHQTLRGIAEGYNIKVCYLSELIEVKGKERIAVFQEKNGLVERKFDLLHLVPLHKPEEFIKNSGLAAPTGYADVDIHTLQHKQFKNIWAMGDCAELPTSKTLSAVACQIHVVAENLASKSRGKELSSRYDGYTACPVITDKYRTMFCEFGYDNKLMPTFVNKPKPSILAGILYRYGFRISSHWGMNHWVQPTRTFYRNHMIFKFKDRVLKALGKKDD